MPTGRVTMRDIADLAGVSVSTVSRVLGGVEAGIPADTSDRVRDAAVTLGYRRNAIASGLRRSTTDTLGFVSDVIASTPNAGAMVQGAQDAAWTHGKLLLLVNTGGDPEVEHRAIEALLERRVEGLIYATMYHRDVEPPPVSDSVACVLLDATSASSALPSVVPDEARGAAEAVELLAELGHQRIGFINSSADIPAARLRRRGFEAEMARRGLPVEPALLGHATDGFDGGRAAARSILDRADRPTALFCFNDRMAAGAMRAAHELGITVPHDLSVVGFDNQELVALLTDPPLSTLQLPHYEMGRWAVDHLMTALTDRGHAQPEHHLARCRLVERESTARPPGERSAR